MGRHYHNKLRPRFVETIKAKGIYHDGGGLYLQVGEDGRAKSWLFRYKRIGRPGEANMGLGPLHTVSLADARESARECRLLRLKGIDPIEHRRAERVAQQAAAAQKKTFAYCAKEYLDLRASDMAAGSLRVMINRVRKYLLPALGKLLVSEIDVPQVYAAIIAIHEGKSQTAMRARLDLEAILDWAKSHNFRKGDNPANWAGAISNVLPNVERLHEVKPFKSLPYEQVGLFMARLRSLRRGERYGENPRGLTWFPDRNKWQARIAKNRRTRINLGFFSDKEAAVAAYQDAELKMYGKNKISRGEEYMMPALLFEFIILTGVRSGQAANARWDEIDWDNRLWTCSKHKTVKKSKGKPYIVVLSNDAIAVLRRMQATQAEDKNVSDYVFVHGQSEASAGAGQSVVGQRATEFTSIVFLKRTICHRYPEYNGITVHGFRKTFSSWAHDQDCFSHEAIEIALGHRLGDQIAEIYNRDAKYLASRRTLMDAWADHCDRPEPLDAKVIPMRTAKREGER